jgi:hypothetical protein
MSTALRDVSVALRLLIEGQLGADTEVQAMLPPGSPLRVSLNTPEEMGDANEQGLSLWLYRVVRDEHRLNSPPRRVAPDRLRQPPLPLRLHYLLTPVFERAEGVSAPEFEQTLLGKVLQLFHDHPTLRGADLAGALGGTDLELNVRLETLTLEEITRVWDALERSYQLCLSYEVSLVPIEARQDLPSGPPVMVVAPVLGVATELVP